MPHLGALRAAARIARRDARRAKGRTALVALLVGLPAFAGTAGGVLIQSTTPTDATYARYALGDADAGREVVQARVGPHHAADVRQSVRGDSASWGTSSVPEPAVAEHERSLADALPDGDRLLLVVRAAAALSTQDRAVPAPTDVLALPEDGDVSAVFPVDAGLLPATAHELALSADTAERLGAGVGDAVAMEIGGTTREMTVTGTLADVPTGPRVVTGPGAVAVPESASAVEGPAGGPSVTVEWFVVGPEPVTWDHVLAVNAVGSVATSRAVLLDPPTPDQVPGYTEGAGYDAGTVALGAGIAAVILLEAVLLIGPAFAMGARRNERQLAMLAAAGAERRTLRHVVLLTGLVTGLAAAVGGVATGLLTAVVVRAAAHLLGHPYVFPDLRVPWLVVVGVAVLGTLAATLAAWLPSRRAARVDVVAALAGRRPPVRNGRRLAVVGAVVAVAGLVAAVVGAVMSVPTVLVGGVVALELGVVAAAGALVGAAALLAPRLGVTGRIALRDAARNRSRTAPAVAAVVAAVAGITAGAVYLQSGQDRSARLYAPFAAVGTVAVELPAAATATAADLDRSLDAAAGALEEHLPVTAVQRVGVAVPVEQEAGVDTWVALRTPPENECPLWAPGGGDMSRAERAAAARDGRCRERGGSGQVVWVSSGSTTLVDDGSAVGALGFEGSPRAAQALADGRAVVSSALHLRSDGTVRVAVERYEGGAAETVTVVEADLPAELVELPGIQYGLVLPPEALDRLQLEVLPVGLVAAVSRPPAPAEEAAVEAALGAEALVHVEHGNPYGQPALELLVLVAAAVVVGLATTGISVALAAAEARPDLATLAAVGAEPRTRRRFTAAQAGVVSVLGTTLGVLAGLALGWVLVTAERYRWAVPDYGWQLSVPAAAVLGIAVGVPLLAVLVGYAASRSRMPVVRRVAA